MTPLLQPAGCSVLVIDPREEHLGQLQPHQQKAVAQGLQLVEQAVQAATVPIHLAFPGVPHPERSIVTFGNAAPPRIHDLGDSGSSWSHSGLATALGAQGRPSLILCGFWLETTVTFIALPALANGFDVVVLMDAAPALADSARDPAAHRLLQAGAVPATTRQLVAEWLEACPIPEQRSALSRLVSAG